MILFLRNLLVSADNVTVRKPISLSFLKQQADKKIFHAGDHLFMCCGWMFLNTFCYLKKNLTEI